MPNELKNQPTLLLVDDEPANLHVLRQILQNDYRLLFARDGNKALALCQQELPDLILLDIMMPDMTGFEVCETLKLSDKMRHIPVIFVTALNDALDETRGFDAGAVDYITKPVSPPVVRARVRNHLSLVRVDELRETRLQVVQRLGLAAEYKDNETGLHVIRMSHFSQILARAAGFSDAAQEEILHASPMHDIGKIGIPDAILAKPGKLDADEWDTMKQHPLIGAHIIGEQVSGLLLTARRIALHHHEKWDGSGYPDGLAGEDIPIEARIVAIADVFDALVTARPYKEAWPVEKAVALIRSEAGKHFDPHLVELFLEELPQILEIKERWAEPE
ncbi:MAG: two-component system response regulator [Pseudohongiella sp.]|uniref:HD domain-containing phosphohydrolase n=1 Tax=Pseudohongiella sp. TaxID=1979412 RepID=UPI0034A02EEE